MQETHDGIAGDGEKGGASPQPDGAAILAQALILDVVEAIFDAPVAAPQRQQPLGGGDGGRQAGEAVVDGAMAATLLLRGWLDAQRRRETDR